MPLMKSPYSSKPVTVSDEMVARYEASGFVVVTDEQPESEAPKKASAPASRRTAAKTPKKTTDKEAAPASRDWLTTDDK